jgi:hypothetical protein
VWIIEKVDLPQWVHGCVNVPLCPRQEGSRFYGLRCVRWCKGPKQEKQQVKNQNESSCWAGIRTYRTVVGYVVGDFFGRCKGHLTSEPVRKEMTKKLSFTAQRKFVLHVLVSHVPWGPPCMSKLRYQEQSNRGCNAFYPMGTGVRRVCHSPMACTHV